MTTVLTPRSPTGGRVVAPRRAPWVRRYRDLHVGPIVGTARRGGRYRAILRDVRGNIRFDSGWRPNLLVNSGLDYMLGTDMTSPSQDVFTTVAELAVGTASNEPQVTDTQLGSEIDRVDRQGTEEAGYQPEAGDHPPYWYRVSRYQFDTDEANGNLTEFGIFSSGSTGGLVVRQLFRDDQGNPVTLTKTSDNILQVFHELRGYPPQDWDLANITLGGNQYAVRSRAQLSDQDTGWGNTQGSFGAYGWHANMRYRAVEVFIGDDRAIGVEPDQAYSPENEENPDGGDVQDYAIGTHYRDVVNTWEPPTANFTGGIGGAAWWGGNDSTCAMVTDIDPPIPKTDTERLILTFRCRVTREDTE